MCISYYTSRVLSKVYFGIIYTHCAYGRISQMHRYNIHLFSLSPHLPVEHECLSMYYVRLISRSAYARTFSVFAMRKLCMVPSLRNRLEIFGSNADRNDWRGPYIRILPAFAMYYHCISNISCTRCTNNTNIMHSHILHYTCIFIYRLL